MFVADVMVGRVRGSRWQCGSEYQPKKMACEIFAAGLSSLRISVLGIIVGEIFVELSVSICATLACKVRHARKT